MKLGKSFWVRWLRTTAYKYNTALGWAAARENKKVAAAVVEYRRFKKDLLRSYYMKIVTHLSVLYIVTRYWIRKFR